MTIRATRSSKLIRVTQVLEATAGGTRRHLREVVSALAGSDFEVHIVCAIERDSSFEEDIEAYRRDGHEVSVLQMAPDTQPVLDLRAAWKLRRLLLKKPCDILHLHSAKAGLLGRLAARSLPCVVIYTPHGFRLLQEPLSAGRQLVHRLAERLPAGRTDVLLAVSEAEARLAVESHLVPARRARVLPNALDVPGLENDVGELAAIPEPTGPRAFGLVGELRRQKAPMIFLEAARRLRDRGVDAKFVLPARGELRPAVDRFIERHSLAPRVEFVPAEKSLADVYRRIDIAVLPSLWEGLPYALLEVLALERPTITSRLPVFEDMLNPIDADLLCATGDSEALSRCMEFWTRVPADRLARVGLQGRRQVMERHRLSEWQERLRKLYQAAWASGRPT